LCGLAGVPGDKGAGQQGSFYPRFAASADQDKPGGDTRDKRNSWLAVHRWVF
jgi:hypothetical protein